MKQYDELANKIKGVVIDEDAKQPNYDTINAIETIEADEKAGYNFIDHEFFTIKMVALHDKWKQLKVSNDKTQDKIANNKDTTGVSKSADLSKSNIEGTTAAAKQPDKNNELKEMLVNNKKASGHVNKEDIMIVEQMINQQDQEGEEDEDEDDNGEETDKKLKEEGK